MFIVKCCSLPIWKKGVEFNITKQLSIISIYDDTNLIKNNAMEISKWKIFQPNKNNDLVINCLQ